MNLGMQAYIGQSQDQVIAPAVLQSVRILQKTSQEVETAIKEEIEVNPLLEVDDNDFDDQEVPVDKDPEELDPRANESDSEYPEDIESMAQGSLDDTADVDGSYLDGESADVNWDSYLPGHPLYRLTLYGSGNLHDGHRRIHRPVHHPPQSLLQGADGDDTFGLPDAAALRARAGPARKHRPDHPRNQHPRRLLRRGQLYPPLQAGHRGDSAAIPAHTAPGKGKHT